MRNGSRFAQPNGDVLRPQQPDSRLKYFAMRHGRFHKLGTTPRGACPNRELVAMGLRTPSKKLLGFWTHSRFLVPLRAPGAASSAD